ncbi:exonuclease domain-containing protein [Aurantibacter aestuarii]|uniref:Exonuclease n=1 Tax=Aurantibacter aestuarii TaxID=1266046 RepID=A0A2T1N8B4_9FLAO|nr:exonuclease domain-containing protein [Aurantibacter aestuarii]PSG88108.1 exonuclease [Aurantibacter aestuarii]
MYAILDIETTGGKFNEEGITEIAIYKFNGHEITDQFISLVNPERDIQPFVVKLTGINSNMLKNAPKFYEVAKRIVEITEDCILVAHNSSFDYRILQTEFNRLGFDYKKKTLCTVELSQKLIPDLPSYSLGKLVRSLGIPVTDRHRASGDALATVKLFKLLLDKDSNKTIVRDTVKKEQPETIKPKHLDLIRDLPNITGVYYLHNANGDIIYVGKSKNIKNRVNQHFTGTSKKAKHLQKQVSSVTFEACGNEMIALLKESDEIKSIKPYFNRALTRNVFTYALYKFTDENGYINLSLDKADGRKKSITTFTNKQSGTHFLEKMVEDYNLCLKLVGLERTNKACFNQSIKKCIGACIEEESAETYNKRIQELIKKYSYEHQNMIIVDRGRTHDERSAVLIKNGVFKGYGYFNLNHQINNIKILETIITPMENNRDTQHIIQAYLRKHPKLKIIPINLEA